MSDLLSPPNPLTLPHIVDVITSVLKPRFRRKIAPMLGFTEVDTYLHVLEGFEQENLQKWVDIRTPAIEFFEPIELENAIITAVCLCIQDMREHYRDKFTKEQLQKAAFEFIEEISLTEFIEESNPPPVYNSPLHLRSTYA